jgi:hypothetical protein
LNNAKKLRPLKVSRHEENPPKIACAKKCTLTLTFHTFIVYILPGETPLPGGVLRLGKEAVRKGLGPLDGFSLFLALFHQLLQE